LDGTWRSIIMYLRSQGCTLSWKSSPTTHHGVTLGERRYSSYSFLISALDGGEWSASRPGRTLPPGKGHPVPIVQEAGWAREPVWTQRLEEKSLSLPGIEPRSPSRPARSQTLYWLSYPGSMGFHLSILNCVRIWSVNVLLHGSP
jgi:hypothetical protein